MKKFLISLALLGLFTTTVSAQYYPNWAARDYYNPRAPRYYQPRQYVPQPRPTPRPQYNYDHFRYGGGADAYLRRGTEW